MDFYISDLYNDFSEIQILTNGFSKPIWFYYLPLVKLLQYSLNKSRGPESYSSFYSWLEWAQLLLKMSITYGDIWCDHLGNLGQKVRINITEILHIDSGFVSGRPRRPNSLHAKYKNKKHTTRNLPKINMILFSGSQFLKIPTLG